MAKREGNMFQAEGIACAKALWLEGSNGKYEELIKNLDVWVQVRSMVQRRGLNVGRYHMGRTV